ncbi:MAG: acetyl-CoA carboxylase biotin carboxyl carrier protein [Bdellovibrio sp.]|nr:acetyl-CoA carboxylase biotin carboxyl carrier protein [Bdellovibrio sp.]
MEKNKLLELEWSNGTGHFNLKKSSPNIEFQNGATTRIEPSEIRSKQEPQKNTNNKQILSPFVGIFYRASSPGAEPYVQEGQHMKRGEPLCIIEAMKLMNVIESEYSGKIVSVLIENGQPVEFEEPLFLIDIDNKGS